MTDLVRLSPSGPVVDVGGAAGDGVTSVRWVDPATELPTADQTGSAIAPFKTLAQALVSLAAVPALSARTIVLADGDYGGESLEWAPAAGSELDRQLELVGFGGATNIGPLTVTDADAIPVTLVLRSIGRFLASSASVAAIVATGQTVIELEDSSVGPITGGSDTAVQGSRSTTAAVTTSVLRGTDFIFTDAVSAVSVELQQSRFNAPATFDNAAVVRVSDCFFVDAVDASAAGSLIARDTVFSRGLAWPSGGPSELWSCTIDGEQGDACEGGAVSFHECNLVLPLAGSADVSLYECVFLGDLEIPLPVAGTNLTVSRTTLRGNVTASAELAIDRQSWQECLRRGFAATGATFNWLDIFSTQQTLASNLAAPVVHTLLPVGHPAGMYNVSFAIASRVGAAGTVTPTFQFTDPNLGLTNYNPSLAAALNPAGFKIGSIVSIPSSGATALTVTFTGTGLGAGVSVDLRSTLVPAGDL